MYGASSFPHRVIAASACAVSPLNQMRHDKVFLSWFLPLAIAMFLSAPLAVLRSFDLIDQAAMQLHKYGSMVVVGLVGHSENQAASNDPPLLPNELPLLFQMESYPYTGKKIAEVHDICLMDMTFTATNGSEENLNASPSLLLGYIPIVEMRETQKRSESNYPDGHLILVTRVSLESSPSDAVQHSMRLETQYSHRRFRVKTVRKDVATSLLFGQVEWLR